ncbi:MULTISPECIES: hypothetical protein [unclassified Mesorhizobium]|uniref:hypothetical protein n=1 Tax=unclassified Mesorhizobium TaxID=325217 RepID=UPI000FCCDCB1|nr:MULTISPECIES: hypothetical protein [unclassified Mesorhizobium]RUW77814.1 hypothetical protein EOA31_03505 [Mesorhizobium sp. M4B.F.Ca.ET.049.02.1.2]TGV25033.1 hypothetical protein EN786_16480 [Mesorhizobium sp. M4B.F.Ca.ET.143.01.1.1]
MIALTDPDLLFPSEADARVASALCAGVEKLPIVSPHGSYTGEPASALLGRDHGGTASSMTDRCWIS